MCTGQSRQHHTELPGPLSLSEPIFFRSSQSTRFLFYRLSILEQYSTHKILAAVDLDNKFIVRVTICQDWSVSESNFHLLKSTFMFTCPSEIRILSRPLRAHRGSIRVEIDGKNLDIYWTMPQNLRTPAASVGLGIFMIASTLHWSACMPSAVIVCP